MVHIGELKQALKELYGVVDKEKEAEGKMEANELIEKMKRAHAASHAIDMLQTNMLPQIHISK